MTEREALLKLVSTIENTGGLVEDIGGILVPAADQDWDDLADAYLAACEALGQEPKVQS